MAREPRRRAPWLPAPLPEGRLTAWALTMLCAGVAALCLQMAGGLGVGPPAFSPQELLIGLLGEKMPVNDFALVHVVEVVYVRDEFPWFWLVLSVLLCAAAIAAGPIMDFERSPRVRQVFREVVGWVVIALPAGLLFFLLAEFLVSRDIVRASNEIAEGRFASAEPAIRRLVELHLDCPLPWALAAILEEERGNPEAALAAIRDAREVAPDSSGLAGWEARLLWKMGRGREAFGPYLLGGARDRDVSYLLMAVGEPEAALRWAERAATRGSGNRPETAWNRLALVRALIVHGETDRARDTLPEPESGRAEMAISRLDRAYLEHCLGARGEDPASIEPPERWRKSLLGETFQARRELYLQGSTDVAIEGPDWGMRDWLPGWELQMRALEEVVAVCGPVEMPSG